jgi:predicted 3-demethylubiquinone-9 3-methyltransferase (glyoxalase superfamily)
MKRINAFLWFDSEAEEAAKFYLGIFKNSKIDRITRYGEAGPGPKGSVMTVDFTLDGVRFVALNGGPQFKFTEAISFNVNCETQEEIDYFWEKLSADGGSTGPCGWLKDKFGLSWQVTPLFLGHMLADPDAEKANRVMKAIMEMGKIDIAALNKAAISVTA